MRKKDAPSKQALQNYARGSFRVIPVIPMRPWASDQWDISTGTVID